MPTTGKQCSPHLTGLLQSPKQYQHASIHVNADVVEAEAKTKLLLSLLPDRFLVFDFALGLSGESYATASAGFSRPLCTMETVWSFDIRAVVAAAFEIGVNSWHREIWTKKTEFEAFIIECVLWPTNE